MALIKDAEQQASTYMFWLVVLCVVLVCFTSCLCCIWSSLAAAVNVIDASADFIRDTFLRLFLIPIFHFIFSVVVFALWVPCLFCVISMNTIKADKTFPQLKDLTWRADVFGLTFFMVFALIWLLICVENLSNMVVMVSSATYYWNNSPETVGAQVDAEVGLAWWITYCNHFGSVAIGSFLCAVVTMLKYTVMVICHYLEEIQGENKVVECLKGCALCFIGCLELITEYITNSAFSYIAVTGDGFCYGAYSALILRLKHLMEFATTMFIAKIVIFIGKVAIVAANIFLLNTILKMWF